MKYIMPMVPGEFGLSSKRDASTNRITEYIYCFDHPNIDDLFTSHPEFFVTKKLGDKLEEEKCTGFSLTEIKTILNDQYIESYGQTLVPKAYRVIFENFHPKPDLSVNDYNLMISDRVVNILKDFKLSAEVEIVSSLTDYDNPMDRVREYLKKKRSRDQE